MRSLEHDDISATPRPRAAPRAARSRVFAGALLLPFAVTVLGMAPYLLLPRLDGADRALVWVAGDDMTLARLSARVESDTAFAGGATRVAMDVPDGCPSGALRLHFDVSRVDQAQPARIALERLAAETGALVCASDRYEIGRRDDAMAWAPPAASLALPLGLLLAMRLAGEPRRRRPVSRPALAALAAAALGVALVPAPADIVPWPATVAFALAAATVHEVAFRGWLMARLLPSIGAPAAIAVSTAASGIAAWATGGASMMPAAVAVAASCALLYQRSRSVVACIALNSIAVAAVESFAG